MGTGKTHMATALGVEACSRGHAVQFFRSSDLVALLQEKFAVGTLSHFREMLRKMELIILDEVGYVPFSQTGSELLFNVIADCYEQQSVIVTSNGANSAVTFKLASDPGIFRSKTQHFSLTKNNKRVIPSDKRGISILRPICDTVHRDVCK